MRSRILLVSALVVVLGAALFLAGMWVGGRRTSTHVATTAGVQSEKTIKQPQKPEPPSTKPADKPSPECPKLVAKPAKSSSTRKPSISKVTVSDKEYARGKVIDPSGRALMGAEITIGGAWVTHAITDSDGKFRIEVPQLEWKPGG